MAGELVFLSIYLEALENPGNYQCLEDSLSLCPTKLQDALMNLSTKHMGGLPEGHPWSWWHG